MLLVHILPELLEQGLELFDQPGLFAIRTVHQILDHVFNRAGERADLLGHNRHKGGKHEHEDAQHQNVHDEDAQGAGDVVPFQFIDGRVEGGRQEKGNQKKDVLE